MNTRTELLDKINDLKVAIEEAKDTAFDDSRCAIGVAFGSPDACAPIVYVDGNYTKSMCNACQLHVALDALARERHKFQQETRRTSELISMLNRVAIFLAISDGPPGAHSRGAILNEIHALLRKPINAECGK